MNHISAPIIFALGPLTLPGRREICLLRRVILESFDLYEAKTPLTSAGRSAADRLKFGRPEDPDAVEGVLHLLGNCVCGVGNSSKPDA